MTKQLKEPWDFDAFVRYYNEIARERSGWNFEPKEDTNDALKQTYEGVNAYRSLREYAKHRFVYDQETGVEGSD